MKPRLHAPAILGIAVSTLLFLDLIGPGLLSSNEVRRSRQSHSRHRVSESIVAPLPTAPDAADSATRSRLAEQFGRMPLCFEPNVGQVSPNPLGCDFDARFVSSRMSGRMYFSPTEAAFPVPTSTAPTLTDQPPASPAIVSRVNSGVRLLIMRVVGGDQNARMTALEALETRASYFIGNDPLKWRSNIPTFARIVSEKVYPGIDLVYRGNQRQLEYDFVVSPGASPAAIRLHFDGVQNAMVDSAGDLQLELGGSRVTHKKPVAYQERDGARTEIAAAFRVAADGTTGFDIGEYDASRELVIDPTLVYSMYHGGTNDDFATAILVDSDGGAFIAGESRSPDFTNGTASNSDVFVGRITPNGGVLTYSFFGGSNDDSATGLAVDETGNKFVCGSTQSDDFPLLNTINTELSGESDIFVTGLNPEGTLFLNSVLLGGSGAETLVSMAMDGSGDVYLHGQTTSEDFPAAGPIQAAYGGGATDSFVAKMTNGATPALVYSTYLGGSGSEDSARTGIAIDADGNAYVTGDTNSADFPTANALQATKNGAASSFDAYVAKINPDGSALVYSTFAGGTGEDSALDIAIDSAGNAYVTGVTNSTSFSGSTATRPAANMLDAFVAKLNAAGSAYSYLTFIGGTGNELGGAIEVDSSGNAYVTGRSSARFTTVNAIQAYFTGGLDVIVARLSSAGAVNFSTFLGGGATDSGLAIDTDSDGNIYVAGISDSLDFPALDGNPPKNRGEADLIIAKIDPDETPDGPFILKTVLSGNELSVFGQNFSNNAQIRVNDIVKGTKNGEEPSQILISKKAGKKIKPGKTVQVQVENANGRRSNIVFVTRPPAP